jgi:hypothetical protein
VFRDGAFVMLKYPTETDDFETTQSQSGQLVMLNSFWYQNGPQIKKKISLENLKPKKRSIIIDTTLVLL